MKRQIRHLVLPIITISFVLINFMLPRTSSADLNQLQGFPISFYMAGSQSSIAHIIHVPALALNLTCHIVFWFVIWSFVYFYYGDVNLPKYIVIALRFIATVMALLAMLFFIHKDNIFFFTTEF
jgi:hypothetical protein